MQQKLLALFMLIGSATMHAQSPTWATEIAPILYKHCVSCHRAGGVGGFPLETYTDAKGVAGPMLAATETREMPPYRANPAYRHFKEENYLTDTQIQTIADWVNGAQAPGDLSNAPPLPNFQNGSQLSSVDLTLTSPSFTINSTQDIYRAFALPTNFATDKFFNEIEFVPGNNEIVHHIVLYTDPTDEPLIKDQADPGPGWSTNGMVGGITQNASLIGEWTPGGTPIKLPKQFGYRIPANGNFIIEVHYAPDHVGEIDSGSGINLRFNTNTPRELYYGVLAQADTTFGLLNPPFVIPANTVHTLHAEMPLNFVAPVPLSLMTLTPHAHIFGKSFKAYVLKNNANMDTIPLIDVPRWDFYWQSTYTLQKPLKLLPSQTVRADVTYDNTVNNPEQPFFPPQDVYWGEKTTNEMLFLFATVAEYEPGDENIILDSLLLASSIQVVTQDNDFTVVNPISEALDIRAKTPINGMVDFILTDLNGRTVRQWREQNLSRSYTAAANLTPGIYILQIRQAGKLSSYKIVKL
jgi:hypothetical protein